MISDKVRSISDTYCICVPFSCAVHSGCGQWSPACFFGVLQHSAVFKIIPFYDQCPFEETDIVHFDLIKVDLSWYLLLSFYRCFVECILTYNAPVWYRSSSQADKKYTGMSQLTALWEHCSCFCQMHHL